MHLGRIFLLFSLTLLLLFTLARVGFNLWQFHKIPDTQTLVQSFVQGLRFDLATIGLILLLPILVVPFFAMFNLTKGLSKFIVVTWMLIVLVVVLVLELITPYFLSQSGVRPDLGVITEIEKPVELISQLWSKYLVPAVIGVILIVLILLSFWNRLEVNRMLRYPVKKLPAICFMIVGVALCLFAVHSSVDISKPPMGVDAAVISVDSTVNEITLNSAYKGLMNYASSLKLPIKLPLKAEN